jgi:hypothetical protein
MAYMSKEHKQEIANLLKKEFGTDAKKRGFKYSLGIENYSTIVMTISSGDIDFINEYMKNAPLSQQMKEYYKETPLKYLTINYHSIQKCFTGKALEILTKAYKILNHNNHDNSDPMTDYYDVGHYTKINIGKWDKAYQLTK